LRLAKAVQDLYFPNWTHTLGWRAVGQRHDVLDGRQAVTVYYRARGWHVAYTILASPALPQPQASTTTLGGVEMRTLNNNGRTIVTWRRAGHTCVISATGVPVGVLQKLASYNYGLI
jgi:hypothetical protein